MCSAPPPSRKTDPPIVARIAALVNNASVERFDDLARDAFAFQFQSMAPLRRLCQARGASPTTVRGWRDIPPVPTTAFATVALHAAPPVEIFRSSGTTGARRSVHHHPFPDLYRAVVDASFPAFCLPNGERPPMLSLIPPRSVVPDSSLGFMVDHVMARHGDASSIYAFDDRGVDVTKATRWCRTLARSQRPVMILATAFALLQWLDDLASTSTRIALPPGSTVFETGGFKGRSRETSRAELLTLVTDRLDVPSARVVREYGMSELTSQLYSRALLGGDPEHLVAPPWMRVRVLDPQTLAEVQEGTTGLISLFDLANLGSALHLLTEDLGTITPAGLALVGRASDADLRGCSLTAEAMAASRDAEASQ